MMRSLWTAASGMTAQQFNIDTISNNLANVNTTGFKQNRADFEDLLYQTSRIAGTPATEVTVVPTGTAVHFPNRDTVRHHLYSFSPVKTFEIKLYVGTPAASKSGRFDPPVTLKSTPRAPSMVMSSS